MFFIGLDLGQRRDFSAIAVVQRQEKMAVWSPNPRCSFLVRHLERMDLGTSYTKVAGRVCEMLQSLTMLGPCKLVVDATGVGAPVVDLLKDAGMGARTTAVTITGAEHAHGSGERWSVPKKDLLTGLEVLLEAGDLVISSQLKDAERLIKELERMRLASPGTGKTLADGPEHDDLALALALACWRAKRGRNGFGTSRLPGI